MPNAPSAPGLSAASAAETAPAPFSGGSTAAGPAVQLPTVLAMMVHCRLIYAAVYTHPRRTHLPPSAAFR